MPAPHQIRRSVAAAVAASLLTLSACSKSADDEAAAGNSAPSGDTLAETLARSGDLSTVAGALRDSGLRDVFDSTGSYTILAPTDEAFAKLGDAGKTLRQPDQRAKLAAVLRDHVVPGYLTPGDIENAIEAEHGQVKVETMGDHELEFTRGDDGIEVANEDGSAATISGKAIEASNGVAIPIDGVLKDLTP